MFDYFDPDMPQQHYDEILKEAEEQHMADSLPAKHGHRVLIWVLQALVALLPRSAR